MSNDHSAGAIAVLTLLFPCCLVAQPPAPATLADQMEASWKQYEVARYEATVHTVHNARAFVGEPLLVSCEGRYEYASDGLRWRVVDARESPVWGSQEKNRSSTRSGYDGSVYYEQRDDSLFLGVDSATDRPLSPRGVFWRGGISTDWLLSALRREEAKVVGQVELFGTRCWHVRSAWSPGPGQQQISFDIRLSVDEPYFPRQVLVERNGQLDALWEMPEVARTETGLLYPRQIRWQRADTDNMPLQELTIDSATLGAQLEPRLFALPDPLPCGIDVVDYRAGIAWHNDPWYGDLEPWLHIAHNWPRPSTSSLHELSSYCEAAMAGKEAPALQVAHWICGAAPGPWSRPQRKVTVVYFLGGRAITPTPRQLNALRALYDRYHALGLEIVAVATDSSTPELTVRSVRQFDLPFPVAIDMPFPQDSSSDAPRGAQWGATFAAFGQTAYTGVVLIDRQGLIQLVEADQSRSLDELSVLESLVRNQLEGGQPLPQLADDQLSNQAIQQLQREWKMLVAATPPEAAITGRVAVSPTAAQPDSAAAPRVRITATPELRLLSSNTPGGWIVLPDRARAASVAAGPDGAFALRPLHKGAWRLVVRAPGLAALERTVQIPSADQQVTADFQLAQRDEIHGTVLDSIGRPIAQARVQATRRHTDPTNLRRYTTAHLPTEPVHTDAQGRFQFTELFEGSYTLEVSANGYATAEASAVPAGQLDVQVLLRKAADK